MVKLISGIHLVSNSSRLSEFGPSLRLPGDVLNDSGKNLFDLGVTSKNGDELKLLIERSTISPLSSFMESLFMCKLYL